MWGGLSGATPSEAVSWGKVNPGVLPDTVVAYCDSTIAFPLFCEYADRLAERPAARARNWCTSAIELVAPSLHARGQGLQLEKRKEAGQMSGLTGRWPSSCGNTFLGLAPVAGRPVSAAAHLRRRQRARRARRLNMRRQRRVECPVRARKRTSCGARLTVGTIGWRSNSRYHS